MNLSTKDKIAAFGIIPVSVVGLALCVWHFSKTSKQNDADQPSQTTASDPAVNASSPAPTDEPEDELALPALAPISLSASGEENDTQKNTPTFPTPERVWTNYRDQLMVASVLDCDFGSGKITMRGDDGQLRSYKLHQLSKADQAYLWTYSNTSVSSQPAGSAGSAGSAE